jgi:NADH-quinone oxidoreductase subunit J
MNLETLFPVILFYAFSLITIASAIVVVAARNPVYSVLFLILSFFSSAGLMILLGAELIAMMLVIVYVGAVAVLFLFVVMMLNIKISGFQKSFKAYWVFGLGLAAVLAAELYIVITKSAAGKFIVTPENQNNILNGAKTNTHAIGNVMFTDFVYPFQISGLILFVAMIGAIVLTLRERTGVRKQNISEQLNRDSKTAIELVKVESGKGVEL